jgi:ribosomal protein S18 acetylase RimI-like enzyme
MILPVLRRLNWIFDEARLADFDTSFRAESQLTLVTLETGIILQEVPCLPPRYKVFPLDGLAELPCVVVAEFAGEIVGLAALRYDIWNRRAVLEHFYVVPAHRGHGLGRHLLDRVIEEARGMHARCLWLEAQNTNPGAIAFYERVGFRWCGFDTSLYDPAVVPPDEFALFFVMDLVPDTSNVTLKA